MTANWYHAARQVTGNSAGTFDSRYPMRGVLHTTEGSSASGAISAYRANNSWPHFTVDQAGVVYQHVAIDRAARSLQNQSGGEETNRAGCIQLEVVGFAGKTAWPVAQVLAMFDLMRWIEAQTGILPQGPSFGSGEQYGLKNPLEFSPLEWRHFNGWCGHQHVPENSHWDPGAINLSALLPSKENPVPETPCYRVNAPAVGLVAAHDPATGDIKGYCILCADGGMFGLGQGVPYLGRVEYVLPAGDAWSPAA